MQQRPDDILSMMEARRLTGRTTRTLRSWTEKGWVPDRRVNGQRVFVRSELEARIRASAGATRAAQVVGYARVSTSEQSRSGDLARQVERVTAAAGDRPLVSVFTDVGSGLNERRRGLQRMLDRIECGDVTHLLVEHPDRLTRFGYGLVERIAREHGCEIEIVGRDEALTESAESELVRDMLSIITSFAGRLHGARGLATQRVRRLAGQELRDAT